MENIAVDRFFLQKPWQHQLEAFNEFKDREHFALFFEQGTGKTSTAINSYRYKCAKAGRLLKCIIFCPPIVVPQWKKEFEKNSKVANQVILLQGSKTERLKLLKDNKNSAKIFVTNYEALLMKEVFEAFVSYGFEFGIFDEAHKLKSHEAKRSKLAQNLADKIEFKMILTGTPVLNNLLDVFQQYRILDGGKTFGSNFWAFRAQWFYDKNAAMPQDRYFPDWKPRPNIEKEFSKLMFQKAMRVEKKDCLDLPPLVRQTIEIEMTKEQRKVYQELSDELITFMQGEAVTAQMALVKALRLQQIVSGFVRVDQDQEDGKLLDTKRDRIFEDNPRKAALKEVLEPIVAGSKVIVWAVFRQNYQMIREVCEALDVKYVELTGEFSAKENYESVHKFQVDPSIRVIIANPRAGGVGVNLVEASYAVWYSRDFSLENDLQGEARNYRGGSEMHNKVTRIDLVCPDTIDSEIVEALRQKKKISDLVLDRRGQLSFNACT
jgi:SNF2 family DNA or RNA helicase